MWKLFIDSPESVSFSFEPRLRMLRISISFPSGCGDTFICPELSKVGDLKLLAQRSFRLGPLGFLKLVTAKGCLLTTDSLQVFRMVST